MRIKFLRSYRGFRTDERWFPAGSIVDLPGHGASALVALGWAEKAKEGQDDEPLSQPDEAVPVISSVGLVSLAEVPGAEAFEDAFNEVEIRTAFDLAHASLTVLTRAKGVGEKRAEQLQRAARELLYPEPEPEEKVNESD